MNNLLFNEFDRLRSGWRFAIYCFLFIVAYSIAQVFLFAFAQGLTANNKEFISSQAFFVLSAFVSLVVATVVGWLCGKFLEDLPIKTLGWVFNRTWIKDYFLGLALGGIAITIAVILAIPSGGISLMLNQNDSANTILLTFATSFLVFFVAGAFEEVLFRGYILQTLIRANLTGFGILITSLFFAIVHNGNPSANFISFLNTFIAGIWFGIAYLKTRSLWLAFGLHLSWNWLQGAFFGINVSGLSQIAPNPLFRAVDQGPTWFTGGHYGVEGGIICTIALLISTTIIWFLPTLKPTEEMLVLTSQENPKSTII